MKQWSSTVVVRSIRYLADEFLFDPETQYKVYKRYGIHIEVDVSRKIREDLRQTFVNVLVDWAVINNLIVKNYSAGGTVLLLRGEL